MTTGNQELADIIRAEIRDSGSISFARFMELALYHPKHGYYSSGRAAIGRRGDYITNVSVGPLFGQLLAAQFIEIQERLGISDPPKDRSAVAGNFTIVEQGAHDGQFALDVLAAIRSRDPRLFEAVRYQIVEPFSALREKQARTLESFGTKIDWIEHIEPFSGVFFSNELLDAMPVDLRGKSVALKDDRFVFAGQTSDHHSVPNASQLSWIDDLAAKLQRGIAIIIDYGFVRSEFREVVQARSHHRLLDSPFEQIGEGDISVHLNWTDIAERAQQRGFEIGGFTDQHHFLTGILSGSGRGGSPEPPVGPAFAGDWGQSPLPAKASRELQTLLHPEMLGRAFQVLALSKGLDLGQSLAGFRFAREPRQMLELE